MKHTSLFRSLFNFRKKEIDAAFAGAQPVASCYGIKVLRQAYSAGEPKPRQLDSEPPLDKAVLAPRLSEGDKQPSDTPHAKFIIIPTRGWPNAPKRNRLRRQVKAIIFEDGLYKKSATYIILLYPVAKDLTRPAVRKFLHEALTR